MHIYQSYDDIKPLITKGLWHSYNHLSSNMCLLLAVHQLYFGHNLDLWDIKSSSGSLSQYNELLQPNSFLTRNLSRNGQKLHWKSGSHLSRKIIMSTSVIAL